MGWRQVIIDSPGKVSFQNGYLILRNNTITKIHISEINILIISSTMVNITCVALCELSRGGVKIVFCDEKYNPYGELHDYYGCCNSSKKILQQIQWSSNIKQDVNTLIIHQKISNQMKLLYKYGFIERAEILKSYLADLELNDTTNREGHAAKVYFNSLFGNEFNRNLNSDINSALNYGYSILLSAVNREISANGCLTQLGVKHCNEFNDFNFACDIMEPFRVIIDEYVYKNNNRIFDKNYKYDLVNLFNKKIVMDNETYLNNAIALSVKSVIDGLNVENTKLLKLYEFV